MGKMISEVEFTNSSVYLEGIKYDADYEIEGNKVILKDDTGIGMINEIIDDHTMRTNMMGIETIYKKEE